ncbi:MAG: hypothetical protein R3F11_31960 [Verrucomicrobiales bacterium]
MPARSGDESGYYEPWRDATGALWGTCEAGGLRVRERVFAVGDPGGVVVRSIR